jgi:hypothetical protein
MCRPNPVNVPRASSANAVYRRVLCSHYDQCLNHAVENDWESFSCRQCDAYSSPDWSESRWMEDRERCLALVGAVVRPEVYAIATSF